jgi:hypothetical protein
MHAEQGATLVLPERFENQRPRKSTLSNAGRSTFLPTVFSVGDELEQEGIRLVDES